MSYSFLLIYQNFDGPLENLMGAKIFNTHARANKHQIWIAYDKGPAKNGIRFILILIVLSQNKSGISQKYPWHQLVDMQSKYVIQSCQVHLKNDGVLNTKGKDRQIQLNNHKKNRWQVELATLSRKRWQLLVTQT